MLNHTLFISDLHLEPAHPELTQLFFKFLEQYAVKADALYILGDFFEAWAGDDDTSEFIDDIKYALKKLIKKGIPIYLMPGNRDFLLGSTFAKEIGCQLMNDPTVINLYGKPIVLTHGDMLCTDDIGHQKYRQYIHNPHYQRLLLKLPLSVRKMLARLIRFISKKRTRRLSNQTMDVNTEAAKNILLQHQSLHLIHGHTHNPAVHHIDDTIRIVLAAWHTMGNMLMYRSDGSYELIYFLA